MDRLSSKGRTRAVMELIARFLQQQASFISLVEMDAPAGSELLRSIYYINLRLGRIMAVASKMAETSGDVYAKRACELLIRAIEIEPAKPDAYKAIRPLMTERAYQTADPKRWMARCKCSARCSTSLGWSLIILRRQVDVPAPSLNNVYLLLSECIRF